ncbi:MAG: arginine--tRNA ligase, partial [Acidimicrobiales bacterium]
MDDARGVVEDRLAAAFGAVATGADPVVRPSERADLQANGAIAVARSLGREPIDVAREVVEHLDVVGICDEVSISGNGFINLNYDLSFLADRLGAMADDERLGIGAASAPQEIVVDYSAPNVAKEMHVG